MGKNIKSFLMINTNKINRCVRNEHVAGSVSGKNENKKHLNDITPLTQAF